MAYHFIQPMTDMIPAGLYHHKLSWKIKEEDWTAPDSKFLRLGTSVPGSIGINNGVHLASKSIALVICWPLDINRDKINVQAVFTLKTGGGLSVITVNSKATYFREAKDQNNRAVALLQFCWVPLELKPELLYDQDRVFIIEAEVSIKMINVEDKFVMTTKDFARDIESIFHNVENSDVLVKAEQQEFKCHKNILGARSIVLKNMLAHDTVESQTNTIVVRDITAEAVQDMLKFIYTGKFPSDPRSRLVDLLHASDMYQIDSLKDACLARLVFNVPNCISTLILVDRYMPHEATLREKVIMFMKCKADEVVDTEDWDKMMDKYPVLAKELVKTLVKGGKEKHLCQFCLVTVASL